MTERPILFSAPMVLALLAGTKTQTRRLVTPQPASLPIGWAPFDDPTTRAIRCPYGAPGDRLWVREAWGYRGGGWNSKTPTVRDVTIEYRADMTRRRFMRGADDESGIPKQHMPERLRNAKRASECNTDEEFRISCEYDEWLTRWWKSWRPSIFLPRWASRLLLEVTGVRVERLLDISEMDAKAEGVEPVRYDPEGDCWTATEAARTTPHRVAYEYLWNEINGWDHNNWDSNPWVWVVSFRKAS